MGALVLAYAARLVPVRTSTVQELAAKVNALELALANLASHADLDAIAGRFCDNYFSGSGLPETGCAITRQAYPLFFDQTVASTDWTTLPGSLDLDDAPTPLLPNATSGHRYFRFSFQYSDNLYGPGPSHSEWRLFSAGQGGEEGLDSPIVSFTLPRTWSGTQIYRQKATPWFDKALLDGTHCDGGWGGGGSCRLAGRVFLGTNGNGNEVHARSIDVQFADVYD